MKIVANSSLPYKLKSGQTGVVLMVALIILLLLSLIGVSGVQSTLLEEKMAGNLQEQFKAIQAAESAARYAWAQLDGTSVDIADFTNNAANTGFYDLRSSGVVTTTGNKLLADWNAVASAGSWPWADATKRAAMPNKIAASDPMKLAAAPQFIIGMHEPILRKGTENRWCIPFSIIGARQGSSANSRALIALKVIPKSGCYRNLVR